MESYKSKFQENNRIGKNIKEDAEEAGVSLIYMEMWGEGYLVKFESNSDLERFKKTTLNLSVKRLPQAFTSENSITAYISDR